MALRLFTVLALLVASTGCCTYPAEVGSLKDVEVKQEKYFGKYLLRVDMDASMTAAEKNDERAAVEALKRQVVSARKSLEGKE